MTGDTHYDLEILAELAEGLLDAGTARQVREHLAVCDPCGEPRRPGSGPRGARGDVRHRRCRWESRCASTRRWRPRQRASMEVVWRLVEPGLGRASCATPVGDVVSPSDRRRERSPLPSPRPGRWQATFPEPEPDSWSRPYGWGSRRRRRHRPGQAARGGPAAPVGDARRGCPGCGGRRGALHQPARGRGGRRDRSSRAVHPAADRRQATRGPTRPVRADRQQLELQRRRSSAARCWAHRSRAPQWVAWLRHRRVDKCVGRVGERRHSGVRRGPGVPTGQEAIILTFWQNKAQDTVAVHSWARSVQTTCVSPSRHWE